MQGRGACVFRSRNPLPCVQMPLHGYARAKKPFSTLAQRRAALQNVQSYGLLKGCTKMALTPLQAASNLDLQASDARESLPQLIFVALHATNLGQLLEDLPFFFVRKTLLQRSLLVTDALGSRGEPWL